MTPFSFSAWYARMGYDHHGGQLQCARDLGISSRHVRRLLRGEREPSASLQKTMELLEVAKNASQ